MVLASKTMWFRLARFLVLPVAAALSLGATGCTALISGENDTSIDVTVMKGGNGQFFNWNEITLEQSIDQVDSATLLALTLDAKTSGADLSFLGPMTAEAVTPTKRTLVATLDATPPAGTKHTSMKVVYFDDLHPLFKDEHTIRIEWNGTLNPAYTAWPEGGIATEATIAIDIE